MSDRSTDDTARATDRPLRIAQIAAPLVDAGVSGHVIELSTHLAPDVRSQLVIAERPALVPAMERARGRGLPVRSVSDWRRLTPEQHAELLVQLDVDIAHLHFSTPFDLVAVLEGAAACGLRTITTDHMVAGGPWGLGTPADLDRRRRASHHATCSIADSVSVRDGLVDFVGLPPAAVHVVHHGVDVTRFSPGDQTLARRTLELPPDRSIIATAGLLVSAKGVDRVIDVLPGLPDEVMLCVLGDGPEKPRLVELARPHGDRVRFAGWRDDMPCWYRAIDLFVHASDTEGWPTVLLEAMATACPVVATAVGGVPEMLDGGDRGTLVPAGDASVLCAAVRAELADRDPIDPDARRRVARAISAAHGLYSVEGMARAVEAIYRRGRPPALPP